MKIIFKVNDFFHSLFPEAQGLGNDELGNFLKDFYSSRQASALVTIDGQLVTVDIKTPIKNPEANPEFKKAVALCDQGNYQKAAKFH